MDIRLLAKGVAFYTVVMGAITVGFVYSVTHSGLYMVGAAGIGVLLAVLGGASGGTVSAGGAGGAPYVGGGGEGGLSEMMLKDIQTGPITGKFGSGLILVLFGFGLVLWSSVVLVFFQSGLQ